MVFSDTTTKQGIIEEIDFICGSDLNTYPIADKTRNVNRAYDRVISLIFQAQGKWQWDDTNQTDLPSATTNVVSGQLDYALDSAHLNIDKVMIKDNGGNWTVLRPFDITDPEINGYLMGNPSSGTPLRYDMRANSIILYPTPNYASTSGLKIFFERPSTYFVSSDTTKSPGFASIFHRFLSNSASYDYAFSKGIKDLAISIKNEINILEQSIQKFYAQRNKADGHAILKGRIRNYE